MNKIISIIASIFTFTSPAFATHGPAMQETLTFPADSAVVIIEGVEEPIDTVGAAQTSEIIGKYFSLCDSYADWHDVHLPINLSWQAPDGMSISGRATMVRNEEIYISMRVMGFEAAVIYANTDSAYFVDKYHKYYFAESFKALMGSSCLTIGNLQDLLLGRAFAPGQGTVCEESAITLFAEDDNAWGIEGDPESPQGMEWWCIATMDDVPVVSSVSFARSETSQADFIYSDVQTTPAGPVAGIVDIALIDGFKGASAQLKWSIKDAKWNTDKQINFKQPNGYKIITTDQLLRFLGQS